MKKINLQTISDEDTYLFESLLESNPDLFYELHNSATIVNNLSDENFFSKEFSEDEERISKELLGKEFNKSDSEREFRIYKTQRLIHSILREFEGRGLIQINKKTPIKNIDFKKEAENIFNNYKAKIK